MREIPVAWPRFYILNVNFGGIIERNIDCFGDGPYYAYQESMDAIAARPAGAVTQQRPEFYSERPQDIQPQMSREERRVEWKKYLTTTGVLALDSQTRMVAYDNLDERWRPEGVADDGSRMGISIASNDGRFPPRSTIIPFRPVAAGHGYIYSVGDHEQLPDGNLGNPLVLRYRFMPPHETK